MDTPEEANTYGLDGYVRLQLPELSKTLNLTESEDITFQLQVTLVSHSEELTETTVTIDPQNTDTYWLSSDSRYNLREYLSYEPSGEMVIGAGETVNITCTVHVPVSDHGFSFNRRHLRGVGIGSENTLIINNFGD